MYFFLFFDLIFDFSIGPWTWNQECCAVLEGAGIFICEALVVVKFQVC